MVRTCTVYRAHVIGACTAVVVVLCAVASVGWAILELCVAHNRDFFTRDMLHVLCLEYSAEARRGGYPSVQGLLAEIDGASVARCWRDTAGMYVDAWGNEVTVNEETRDGERAWIGRSRGPDGVESADDIVVQVPRQRDD